MKKEYIYVIEAKDSKGKMIYKIGKTIDVRKRFVDLCHMSPVPLRLVCSFATQKASEMECLLHRAFVHRRSHGEWFFLSQVYVSWLSNMGDYYLDRNTHEISSDYLQKIRRKGNPDWWRE